MAATYDFSKGIGATYVIITTDEGYIGMWMGLINMKLGAATNITLVNEQGDMLDIALLDFGTIDSAPADSTRAGVMLQLTTLFNSQI